MKAPINPMPMILCAEHQYSDWALKSLRSSDDRRPFASGRLPNRMPSRAPNPSMFKGCGHAAASVVVSTRDGTARGGQSTQQRAMFDGV